MFRDRKSPFRIDEQWWVCNHWCHCCQSNCLSFVRWGKRGATVQMKCPSGHFEWRHVYRDSDAALLGVR